MDQVRVHRPRALEGVEEDDEEHDGPREHDLREEPEAEDHRDERDQRDPGQRVEGDDIGLEDPHEPAVPAEDEPRHEARGHPDEEPPEGGLDGRERHRPDRQPHPARGQIDEALDDGGGPADEERVEPVEPGELRDGRDSREPLPRAQEDREDREPPGEHARALGHLSSCPSACQSWPYSRAYSSASRSVITSRGRGSFTS